MFYYIYLLSLFFLKFFLFLFIPGILEFWCLVTVTFKFTFLYNNIYREKQSKTKKQLFQVLFPQIEHTFASCCDFSSSITYITIFFFSKSIIFLVYSLKLIQTFSIQSFPRYEVSLSSM